MLLAHGVGRVDDQVHDHLVQLGRLAFDIGNVAIFAHHVGLVLDFVIHDIERGIDALAQVGPDPLLVRIRARKILQVLHDAAHARNAFLRLAHQQRYVGAQEVQVDLFAQGAQARRHHGVGHGRLGFLVGVEHGKQIVQVAFQGAEIRKYIADGIVDLVRHAGGQLADRGQLFRLQQLLLGQRQLAVQFRQGQVTLAQFQIGDLALADIVGQALVHVGQLGRALGHQMFQVVVRLAQRQFGQAPFAHIAQGFDGAHQTSLAVAQGRRREMQPVAVGADIGKEILGLKGAGNHGGALQLAKVKVIFTERDIVGHQQVGQAGARLRIKRLPVLARADHLGGRKAQQLFAGAVPVRHHVVRIDGEGGHGVAVEKRR